MTPEEKRIQQALRAEAIKAKAEADEKKLQAILDKANKKGK